MPETRQFLGSPSDVIAFATDPWLQRDGLIIDLEEQEFPPAPENTCDACHGMPIAGLIAPMNSPFGIERCDACGVFEGDFEAALALAALIGPDIQVWFYPSTTN